MNNYPEIGAINIIHISKLKKLTIENLRIIFLHKFHVDFELSFAWESLIHNEEIILYLKD